MKDHKQLGEERFNPSSRKVRSDLAAKGKKKLGKKKFRYAYDDYKYNA